MLLVLIVVLSCRLGFRYCLLVVFVGGDCVCGDWFVLFCVGYC